MTTARRPETALPPRPGAPRHAVRERQARPASAGSVALLALAGLLLIAPTVAAQNRTFKGKQCIVKTDAPKRIGTSMVERIDNYCEAFADFYDELGLDENNDNKIVARMFDQWGDFDDFYTRNFDENTPAAFFSASMNAVVLYNAEGNVVLRQVLFHEVSHNFLNRYIYDCPRWVNEGLAEYFEGWLMSDEGEVLQVRPQLYDLSLMQRAIADDEALALQYLVELGDRGFYDFAEDHPEVDSYLHYATVGTFMYYCLEAQHEGDRELMLAYLRDLNSRGATAEFVVDDWDALDARWRAWVLAQNPERTRVDDHLLVARGFRRSEHWEGAAAEYRAALARDPELVEAEIGLGEVLFRAEEYVDAYDAFERAITLDPEKEWPYYRMALMHVRHHRGDELTDYQVALELAERSVELTDGDDLYNRLMVARVHNLLGDAKLSIKLTKQILREVDRENESAKEYFKGWLEYFEEREDEQG